MAWGKKEEEKKQSGIGLPEVAAGFAAILGVCGLVKGISDKQKIASIKLTIEQDKQEAQIFIESKVRDIEALLIDIEKSKIEVEEETILKFLELFSELKKTGYTPIDTKREEEIDDLIKQIESGRTKVGAIRRIVSNDSKNASHSLACTTATGAIAIAAGGSWLVAAGPAAFFGGIFFAIKTCQDLTEAQREKARIDVEICNARKNAEVSKVFVEARCLELKNSFNKLKKIFKSELVKFQKLIKEKIPTEKDAHGQILSELKARKAGLDVPGMQENNLLIGWYYKKARLKNLELTTNEIINRENYIKTLSFLDKEDFSTIQCCKILTKGTKLILEAKIIESVKPENESFEGFQAQLLNKTKMVSGTVENLNEEVKKEYQKPCGKPFVNGANNTLPSMIFLGTAIFILVWASIFL